jgi:hypothetical protein
MTGVKGMLHRTRLGRGLERAAALALLVLAVSLSLEALNPVLGAAGLVLTNVEAMALIALGLWSGSLLVARRWPTVPRGVGAPVAVWLGTLLISALLAGSHRSGALKFLGRMTAGVLVAWAAFDLGRTGDRRRHLVRAVAAGGLIVAMLGLAEALRVPQIDRFLALFREERTIAGESLRVSATLDYATIASMVLELCIPLILAWMLTGERRRSRALLGVGLALALAVQTLTLTRGGMIALLTALGFLAAWSLRAAPARRRVWMASGATMLGTLVLWAIVTLLNPVARYRLVSETDQSWYRIRYEAPATVTVGVGESVSVPVRVTNAGVRTWDAAGEHAFGLSYHLTRGDGELVAFEGPRAPLPHDLAPAEEALLYAIVAAPAVPGEFVVEWDMVHEGITWFSWEGQPSPRTRLMVSAAGDAAAESSDRGSADEGRRLDRGSAGAERQGRLWLWRVAGRMFVERPLFGVGPDGFRWLYGAHAGVEDADTRVHANNTYVEWLVDTGLIGFAAFLWMSWCLGRTTWPSTVDGKGDSEGAIWQAALFASLIGWYTHGVVDFFYEFTSTYLAFALVSGLALAGSDQSRPKGPICGSDST